MKLHEEVYVLRKQILGVNHPDTLTSLSNLAGSYSDLGDYSKAFELHNTVYNVRKEILGERFRYVNITFWFSKHLFLFRRLQQSARDWKRGLSCKKRNSGKEAF